MRLFIGFFPPEEVAYQVCSIQKHLSSGGVRGKYVKCKNLHLTAKFLGDVDESEIPLIKSVLDKYKHLDAKMEIAGLSWFKRRRGSILFVELGGDVEKLKDFVFEIERELELMGFEREKRKFHPHMTIARKVGLKKSSLDHISNTKIEHMHFKIDKFCLVKSTLTEEGPIYEIIY